MKQHAAYVFSKTAKRKEEKEKEKREGVS